MTRQVNQYTTKEQWGSYVDRINGYGPSRENSIFLDLSGKELTDGNMTGLAEALKYETRVIWLNLRRNKITSQGAKILAEAILEHRKVAKVSLSIFDKGAILVDEDQIDEKVLALFKKITKNPYEKTTKYTTKKQWDDYISRFQGDRIILHLFNAGLTDRNIVALAEALKKDTRIIHLDLTNNRITSVGAKALAAALLENTKLATQPLWDTGAIQLYKNPIGKEGVLAVFHAIYQTQRSIWTVSGAGDWLTEQELDEIEKDPIVQKLIARQESFGREFCGVDYTALDTEPKQDNANLDNSANIATLNAREPYGEDYTTINTEPQHSKANEDDSVNTCISNTYDSKILKLDPKDRCTIS